MKNETVPGDIFATTRWTLVHEAAGSAQSAQALEELCLAYWYPLYAYVRRRGHSREDAEDLTQGFFARFLEKNYLDGLQRERGKFRAFLLAALKHFLANEWDKSQRQKRGGQIALLPIDWPTADSQFQVADLSSHGPDRAFDREWALALLDRVLDKLRADGAADVEAAQFDELKQFLTARSSVNSYADTAERLGLSVGALRVAVHRLRRRYRDLLRHEVAQTLRDPAQIDEEMRTLFGAFRT